MSARNQTIELIKKYYNFFNAGDISGMLSCVNDHIVHDVNQGERRIGKDLFREFCHHMSECYSEQLTDMIIMATDDGKRAAAEFIVNGVYHKGDADLPPARGQTYRLSAAALLEVHDGLIARVTTYYNLQNWIDQVKLHER
jgi:steroid delta-isomerase-like uncharacterized protein